MVSWSHFVAAEPEFARRVHEVFEVRKHKTLATLRRDGSPRISGIETQFEDGELWLGMMPGSRKAADLRRDPRLALHSPTVDAPEDDPSSWAGEAKITGRGIAAPGSGASGEPPDRFRIELDDVVLTYVSRPADHLVIEWWNSDSGLRRHERR
jgi:Pyridoxamine 5'-phosphate oxidase